MLYKGDIFWADLDGGIGREQKGIRPVMIVQNDIGNKYSPTTIICPITKHIKQFDKTHFTINYLAEPSIVLCEQIRVIDKSRLKSYICSASSEEVQAIDKKIMFSLGITKEV